MTWRRWIEELRGAPEQAVDDLLSGAAELAPFERASGHEFLLAILPRDARNTNLLLLGEKSSEHADEQEYADLLGHLDAGLSAWFAHRRVTAGPPPRKLAAYSARVCEALQWPLYFRMSETLSTLKSNRVQWVRWLSSLTISAYRDPEYDYWQVLAAHQNSDDLQFFWHSFIVEAGRTRSARYSDLGLLALAKLPLDEDDSLRNVRVQVQALVSRYQRRRGWGTPAIEDLASGLRRVLARNPSLSTGHYRVFLSALLSPLGGGRRESVLALLGLSSAAPLRTQSNVHDSAFKLKPPGMTEETDHAVQAVRRSRSVLEAWGAVWPLLTAHEDYLHKSGDAYYFVRNLDRTVRALCERHRITEPEIRDRILHWIHVALRVEPDDAHLWLLWELALQQAGHEMRAQWVLWETTKRFPENLPSRVELARLLARSSNAAEREEANHLLQRVLEIDPNHLHAHSTLAQLAIRRSDYPSALDHAQQGLRIDPAHEASAVLLASAYARRGAAEDLQIAIDGLRRFVGRHPGQLKAEAYLRDLVQRSGRAEPLPPPGFEDKEISTGQSTYAGETDPAWLEFARSVRAWIPTAGDVGEPQPDITDSPKQHLSVQAAIRHAIARNDLSSLVLDQYDVSAEREFPLEVRLWRYLQAAHLSSVDPSMLSRAKQAVDAWIDAEREAPSQDSPFWIEYLTNRWDSVNRAGEAGLTAGKEWLKELLERYRTLPLPLLV